MLPPGDGAPPPLELAGIGKTFGGVVALRDVDFTLAKGEVHGLIGENGAGKSTLMKIIAGVHGDYDGTMRMDGRAVRFRSTRDALAAGIGMVHQELSVVPDLSVAENVFLGRQPTRLGVVRWRAMARAAREQLDDLGIDVDPGTPLGALPLGLQQLVELGRVLFSGARIVILDEPTSALSPPEVERLFGVLDRLRAEGRSFVFISHFLEDVLRVADRVTVFRNGRRVETAPAASVDKARLITLMIGAGHESLEESYTGDIALKGPGEEAPVVLRTENLGSAGAFAGVDLSVRGGEVLGVYGFMGCGQLELARALFGKIVPDKGRVLIDGRSVRLRNTAAAKRAGVAFVPESRRSMLFAREPITKNISLPILERLSRLWLKPKAERAIARGHVERLRVRAASVDAELRTLSGGNQQKVALAKWLTHPPKVLVLCEPTRGMDVGAKDDVVRIVRSLKDDGMAVVVVSSEPETVLSLADRIVVMKRGAVVREFKDEVVSKDRLLAAA